MELAGLRGKLDELGTVNASLKSRFEHYRKALDGETMLRIPHDQVRTRLRSFQDELTGFGEDGEGVEAFSLAVHDFLRRRLHRHQCGGRVHAPRGLYRMRRVTHQGAAPCPGTAHGTARWLGGTRRLLRRREASETEVHPGRCRTADGHRDARIRLRGGVPLVGIEGAIAVGIDDVNHVVGTG